MIIDGKYTNSTTEKTIEIECPANKRVFATVPRGNEADVDIAVKSSLKAFRSWSKVMPKERGKILLQIADAIEIEKEDIAKIIRKKGVVINNVVKIFIGIYFNE